MASVGILIVTFNRLKLLQDEVRSIRQQTYKDFNIVVVNNCSSDGTKEWLDDQPDIISIHIGPENIGPAAAFSHGMRFIAEHGFEYCWLMDDDVECFPEALEKLVEAYGFKENIGFLCSKVQGLEGEPMNVPLVDDRPQKNGYPDYADLLSRQMIKVRKCTFVSMFIPCSLIKEKGLPYKEFYNWAVDTEYSLRLSSDRDSYLVNKSVVIHKRLIQGNLDFETEKDPIRIAYYRSAFRNSDFIEIKNSRNPGRKKLSCFTMDIKKAISLLFRGKIKYSRTVFLAAFDMLHFSPVIEYPN